MRGATSDMPKLGAQRGASAMTLPREPFDGWPVHMVLGENEGFVWFVPPSVICLQFHIERCDLAAAKRYVTAIRTLRSIEQTSIDGAGGLRLYQDCRAMRVMDRDARMFLSDAARRDFARDALVFNKLALPVHNPILRIAVQLIAMTVRSFGLPSFELESDLGAELAAAGIRPPPDSPELSLRIAEYERRIAAIEAA